MTKACGHPCLFSLLVLVLSTVGVLTVFGCGSSRKAAATSPFSPSVAGDTQTALTRPPGPSNPLEPGERIDRAQDNAIITSRIPSGQRVRGDGDADNPTDMEGNGDADGGEDGDNDNPTAASYRFPDADDMVTFAYGHPASVAETRKVAGVVRSYFAAAARADGALACPLLVSTLAKSLAEDFGPRARPTGVHAGESCAAVMTTLFRRRHAQLAAVPDVVSVRVQGQVAQAIVASRTTAAGKLLLQGDAGRWWIEQLFAPALP